MHKSITTSRDHAIIRAELWYKPCSYELVNPAIKISLLLPFIILLPSGLGSNSRKAPFTAAPIARVFALCQQFLIKHHTFEYDFGVN